MTVFLLRHADAGDRAVWDGNDMDRPLSQSGWQDARGIVALYAHHPVERILSSPYRRCIQSVEPLADARNLAIETDDDLAEGAPLHRVQLLLDRAGEANVVVCSHGDVIEAVVTDLFRRGRLAGLEPHWPKASTWLLDPPLRASSQPSNRPLDARYLPPPPP